MAAIRVVPSGKVYREMFDAQAKLSLSLHDSRRRRAANNVFPLSGDALRNRDTATHDRDQGALNHDSDDNTTRDQLFSGTRPMQRSVDQREEEEVKGLPDTVVSAKKTSDIIERLMEKRQRGHTEAVDALHQGLSALSGKYESLVHQTGEEVRCKLAECDARMERHIEQIQSMSYLKALTLQSLHEFWDVVHQEALVKRKWTRELDEKLSGFESERAAMITALLKKYTLILEKISYLMPGDVHRLVSNEAMMINQAILANRRAIARLHLNLMEDNLQKEVSYRLIWEDKVQDWKGMKLLAALNRFKDFINSPRIQTPEDVQATLDTMRRTQQALREQRREVLQLLRTLTPPKCSTALVTEWYSSLSAVNEQIDCMHIRTMKQLHSNYEEIWQHCLGEMELFKEEVAIHGFTKDEIEDIVKAELLPLIGNCQHRAEERLATTDRAFEVLAQAAAVRSEELHGFIHGATLLWETHSRGLQRREKQLQDQLQEVQHSFELENQKREAQFDILVDKLRQESTEKALRAALDRTLTFLQELKQGYITLNKEEADVVEGYPSMVLEELQSYSAAVRQYFAVQEAYSPDLEELHTLYPSLKLELVNTDVSEKASRKTQQVGGQMRTRCGGARQRLVSQDAADTPDGPLLSQDDPDLSQVFYSPQTEETFTTAGGNLYHCHSFVARNDGETEAVLPEAEFALFPTSLLLGLQTDVRIKFFTHLEERYHAVLMNTVKVLEAKREELRAELDLRLHLHEPRVKRAETDVHDVRLAELVLHRGRVDRHCKGVLQALADFRNDFQELQVQHHKLTEDFRTQIHSMEDTFTLATKSDTLVKLCGSLSSDLEKHTSIIQASQSHLRQKLETELEDLRDSNARFLKSFKLFSEGGNYTPKEIEGYQKQLEKMAKCIDTAEEAITLDMGGTESKRLEQAKDIVKRFEEKFQFLEVDLKFLEKIQGVLTSMQVQMKAEVISSNRHKKRISLMLRELDDMVDACARHSPDKRVKTADDICNLTASMIEEMRKRCQYLDCFVDACMSAHVPDCPLQGAFAVAARARSSKPDKTGSPTPDALLLPSRMGVPFMDDVAVGVIRGLQKMGKPQATQEVNAESTERISAAMTAPLSSSAGSGRRSGRSPSQTGLDSLCRRSADSLCVQSVKRFSKPTRFDKRFQVFGTKPEEQAVPTFKGFMSRLLWKTNDVLLLAAEDFYKKKGRRPITRPQCLQETFEQCAEELNRRLLAYQSQTQEYHNSCLQEFRQQLRDCEEGLSPVPEALLSQLTQRHLDALDRSLTDVRQQWELKRQQSEQRKKEHVGQLSVRLSHPACEGELEKLTTAERERQQEQAVAIQRAGVDMQVCVKKQGEEFVGALAMLTESLLFQMDNLLTIDEVQTGLADLKRENITTLVRRNQASSLLEAEKSQAPVQRGSRTWSGLRYFCSTGDASADTQQRETAAITTAKTTLVHLRAVEARDTMYQHYQQTLLEELAKVAKESETQRTELVRWEKHWNLQLQTLSTLNSE